MRLGWPPSAAGGPSTAGIASPSNAKPTPAPPTAHEQQADDGTRRTPNQTRPGEQRASFPTERLADFHVPPQLLSPPGSEVDAPAATADVDGYRAGAEPPGIGDPFSGEQPVDPLVAGKVESAAPPHPVAAAAPEFALPPEVDAALDADLSLDMSLPPSPHARESGAPTAQRAGAPAPSVLSEHPGSTTSEAATTDLPGAPSNRRERARQAEATRTRTPSPSPSPQLPSGPADGWDWRLPFNLVWGVLDSLPRWMRTSLMYSLGMGLMIRCGLSSFGGVPVAPEHINPATASDDAEELDDMAETLLKGRERDALEWLAAERNRFYVKTGYARGVVRRLHEAGAVRIYAAGITHRAGTLRVARCLVAELPTDPVGRSRIFRIEAATTQPGVADGYDSTRDYLDSAIHSLPRSTSTVPDVGQRHLSLCFQTLDSPRGTPVVR